MPAEYLNRLNIHLSLYDSNFKKATIKVCSFLDFMEILSPGNVVRKFYVKIFENINSSFKLWEK